MSRKDPLEDSLEQLFADPVAVPAHLLERCLTTIPRSPARPWWRRLWMEKPRMIRQLALVTTLVAVIGWWTSIPRSGHHGGKSAANIALAQSVQTMETVPFWHKHVRRIEFGLGSNPGKEPTVGAVWQSSDEWFDTVKGYAVEAPDRHSISSPSGDVAARGVNTPAGPNGVSVMHLGAEHWKQAKFNLLLEPTQGFRAAGVPPSRQDDVEVTMRMGQWKGAAARIFTVAHHEEGKPWWNFDSRTLLYADLQTGRFLARQVTCEWPDFPNRGEVLLEQTEYDYENRPDPAVFDAKSLEIGANRVLNLYPDANGRLLDPNGTEVGRMISP